MSILWTQGRVVCLDFMDGGVLIVARSAMTLLTHTSSPCPLVSSTENRGLTGEGERGSR